MGETFWIDPPGYDLCTPYYIKSTKNIDMNDPGIRYFHLWDLNPDDNGNLNRIGKVFPDQEIIVVDDEEVIAAMSYKSNRNWTLPAPRLSLLTPNTCDTNSSAIGIFTGSNQSMWFTYILTGETASLHCNYYSFIRSTAKSANDSQNVAVRFGPEFQFLTQPVSPYVPTDYTGYTATSMKLLCQVMNADGQPSPTGWREIDVTDQLTSSMVNGYITMSGITGTTFQITQADYDTSTVYNLANYIDIPLNGYPNQLNFGDEYFFYGNLETDISATIYEMKYLITLGRNQFTNTSNPTWTSGTTSYVTEIGLYDYNKDLIVISKLQSPELRQGIQQYVVKLDF
jgi:hypothetical protein